MLSPDDIQRLCERKYPAFLRAVVVGEPFFPQEIRFGRPSTTDEWAKLQSEITTLAKGTLGYRIDWTESNTRRWGPQRLPQRVWFESEAEFLKALRKQSEVETFRRNLAHTREVCPELGGWLSANARQVVEFAEEWPDLLKVCRYFVAHPRPGLYARELPIAVHTKFVEQHTGILRSLLDFLLPSSANAEAVRFEERFGLRFDEPLIRFRLLDSEMARSPACQLDDLSVPLSQFVRLNWSGLTVFVTENKMNFLTLPAVRKAIAVWGCGNAAQLLSSVQWLRQCRLIYWGDLDPAGFVILSRLRRTFSDVKSLMMDETTLEQYRAFVVPPKPITDKCKVCLTAAEAKVFEQVKNEKLCLEQEKLPQTYSVERIAEVLVEP